MTTVGGGSEHGVSSAKPFNVCNYTRNVPRSMSASLEILPPAHTHTNRLVRNATNVRSSFVNAEAMRDANKTQDRYLGTSKQIITTDIRYTIFLNNNILNSTILRSTCACHRVSPDSNYLSEILEDLIIHLLDVNYTTTTISTTTSSTTTTSTTTVLTVSTALTVGMSTDNMNTSSAFN